MGILIALIILFVPVFTYSIIKLIANKDWVSIYTTIDDETYFKVVGKLKQAGIRYKAQSLFNLNTTPMFGGNRSRDYEILVKKEDVHNASRVLHS